MELIEGPELRLGVADARQLLAVLGPVVTDLKVRGGHGDRVEVLTGLLRQLGRVVALGDLRQTAGLPGEGPHVASDPLAPPSEADEVVGSRKAAEMLGVGRQPVSRLIRDGYPEGWRIGREWAITRSSVLALASRRAA